MNNNELLSTIIETQDQMILELQVALAVLVFSVMVLITLVCYLGYKLEVQRHLARLQLLKGGRNV